MKLQLFVALMLGCSLVNKPDPSLRSDAGVDADSEVDADADVLLTELCEDAIDNDDDGLIDCADYECAAEPSCCTSAATPTLQVSDWTSLSSDWLASRTANGSPLLPTVSAGRLSSFLAPEPFAIVHRDCLPLALGMSIEARMHPYPDGGATCNDGICNEWTALVLSPLASQAEGSRLLDELAVEVHPSGTVLVRRAGAILERSNLPLPGPGIDYVVQVRLAPATNGAGRAALLTEVVVSLQGSSRMEWKRVLIEERNLLRDGACGGSSGAAGLRIAIEGRGEGTSVGSVSATATTCANPNVFQRNRNLLALSTSASADTASLGFGNSWSAGGISAPGLLSHAGSWHVFAETSNDALELDATAPVGFALGHATAEETRWSTSPWSHTDGPWLGTDPPSCLSSSCTTPSTSFRDPHPFYNDTSDVIVAFAQSSSTGRYDLGYRVLGRTPIVTLRTASEEGCQSLRDPAIVPRGQNTYWLFFTCERLAQPSEIRGITVVDSSGFVAQGTSTVVVPATQATFGVRNPEALRDGDTIRLWYLMLGRTGTGVGLASSKLSPLSFLPYPANPVLDASRSELELSGSGSRIESFAIARHPTRLGSLRFLIGRRLIQAGGARRYDFLPLDQPWRLAP